MDSSAPRPADPKLVEILNLLQAAEKAGASGQPAGFAQAVQQFDQAIAKLRAMNPLRGDARRWLGLALVSRGNALRALGPGPVQADALKSFDSAIEFLRQPSDLPEEFRRNDLANAWTNRGIALLTAWPADKLPDALKAFDEAIDARKDLTAGPNSDFHYGLASSWMNRADVLNRMGGERVAEAIAAYDEAIGILQALPWAENDALRHRLAVAWMNRGITRQAAGGDDAIPESQRNFDESAGLLRGHRVLEQREGAHLLACVCVNRAGACLQMGAPHEGRDAAKEAIALLAGGEEEEPAMADISLRARHALCRANTQLLGEQATPDQELIGEATDAVDDGLTLVRLWESRKVQAFRPIVPEFFKFGVSIYERYQPQFLAEFVLDNLDPERSSGAFGGDPGFYRISGEAIARALRDLQQRSFAAVGSPDMEPLLQTLSELRAAAERVQQLARSARGPAGTS